MAGEQERYGMQVLCKDPRDPGSTRHASRPSEPKRQTHPRIPPPSINNAISSRGRKANRQLRYFYKAPEW